MPATTRLFVLSVVAASLSACAAPLPVAFDSKSASNVFSAGNNTIEGIAFTVSRSGYVRNCSRGDIFLVPKTPYAEAWFAQAFQSQSFAYRIAIDQMPRNANFEKYRRVGECDQQGRFVFEHVTDGDYYVFSRIFWLLRWQRNGYALVVSTSVNHGERKQVNLQYYERTDR